MTRLLEYFFGALLVFEENETEWASLLLDLIHGCFDLSDLNSGNGDRPMSTARNSTFPNLAK